MAEGCGIKAPIEAASEKEPWKIVARRRELRLSSLDCEQRPKVTASQKATSKKATSKKEG
jgi:hypothetical protein